MKKPPTPLIIPVQKTLSIAHKVSQTRVDITSAATEADALMALYHNRAAFNMPDFKKWLQGKNAAIQKAAALRPPTQIYLYTGSMGLLCCVAGYTSEGMCVVADLVGNAFVADPAKLKDITDQVRDRYKCI